MISTMLRRIGTTVGLTAILSAILLTGGPTASGSSSSAAQDVGVNAHRVWACSVPAGHTWSSVRVNTNCGQRYEYFLLDAVNYDLTGTWACAIPSGYTYTSSRQGTNCAASSGASPYEYRLAKL
jgi:hypothetical protein